RIHPPAVWPRRNAGRGWEARVDVREHLGNSLAAISAVSRNAEPWPVRREQISDDSDHDPEEYSQPQASRKHGLEIHAVTGGHRGAAGGRREHEPTVARDGDDVDERYRIHALTPKSTDRNRDHDRDRSGIVRDLRD